VEITAPKPKSKNDDLNVPETPPEKLEVPTSLLEEQKSAGMKFIKAQEKQERIGNIVKKASEIGTQVFQGVGTALGA
jgi:hypothetical protein